MTKFHEGQEVEVLLNAPQGNRKWRKAKITAVPAGANFYMVEFQDGAQAVLDVSYIRAIDIRDQLDAIRDEAWPKL